MGKHTFITPPIMARAKIFCWAIIAIMAIMLVWIVATGQTPRLAMSIALALVIAMMLYLLLAMSKARVDLDDHNLVIRASFYRNKNFTRDLLLPKAASVIDLKKAGVYKPTIRTFGVGLPGYGEGWFRLRNGEKAFVLFSGMNKAVMIPTTKGYYLILGVDEPGRLLGELTEQEETNREEK